MELVLAILMGLGIFLVIPVIIGLSTIGIYLLKRRRTLSTKGVTVLKKEVSDVENVLEEAKYSQLSGSSVNGKK